MSRNILLTPDEFYHIYNRGTEKRDVFMDTGDYDRFLALMYLCNSLEPVHIGNSSRRQSSEGLENLLTGERGETLVDITAYCLMPNHFHLLIREKEVNGTSCFMQKLLTGYTMYFNRKYERTGTLFQGKFKASHVAEDRHLKYLLSYIHLNPVKLFDPKWKENGIRDRKKAKQYLREYHYSSYLDYLGQTRCASVILNQSVLPEYFSEAHDFESYVDEWLLFKSSEGIT